MLYSDCKGIIIPYQPLWYNGHPSNIETIFRSIGPEYRWNGAIQLQMLLFGEMFICSILTMNFLYKWGRRIRRVSDFSSTTKHSSLTKTLTQFKIFGWIVTLLPIGLYCYASVKTIHILSTHEEYYPEYFLPEAILGLASILVMILVFLCEYPLIYSVMTAVRSSSRQGSSNIQRKCKYLISRHLSAIGWAGSVYGIQTMTYLMVYIGVYFMKDPFGYFFLIIVDSLLYTAVIVIIVHELYLMLRHPKNCCCCRIHIKILFCIAFLLAYRGLETCLFLLLKHYKTLGLIFDSTKLVEYLISSLCVFLLGYFGKKKFLQIWKKSERECDRELQGYSLYYPLSP